MLKKISLSLLGIFLSMVLFNFDLALYGIEMGYNQVKIVYNAESIECILEKESLPDSLKYKLKFIQEVRAFAIDSLGLKNSENYTEMYNQKGETLLWNLSACDAFSFVPKEWSFPIAGTFPYKGFFDLEKGKKEAKLLKNDGYDVRIRSVGGWSTLGFFKDPILSNMLFRSEGELANLIIHELTHSTLFVKDSIEFNENLATFIGDFGALQFMEQKFGKESREYNFYESDESDTQKFIVHMLNGAKQLDSLYKQFSTEDTDSIKLVSKTELIQNIVESIDTISFYDKHRFEGIEHYKPNNAHFMSFLRYNAKQNEFQMEFEEQYNSNFKQYLDALKKRYGNQLN